ncbi:MAG: hypothetical protein HQL46_00560 [Gammaproteobacteria bacterium]|nr:hypothetical protein [Gammaproteobacteria bacterium]
MSTGTLIMLLALLSLIAILFFQIYIAIMKQIKILYLLSLSQKHEEKADFALIPDYHRLNNSTRR